MRKVLIVEDDRGIREILAAFLREEGFQVLTARNGQEALDLLKQETASLVVLLDLLMPHDGYNVLAWLEEARRLDHQVVVMSAHVAPHESQQWLSKGIIAAFLPKPVNMEKLLALVYRLAA